MQMRDPHFPRRAPIEAYGHGGFRFANMSHRGSILIVNSGIYAWEAPDPARLDAASLKRVFREAEPPELLLIGTGRRLEQPAADVRLACAEHRIGLDVMDTGAAVRTYNVLLAEGRSVGAALIAVD
ncbi:Mth938-like domain-containing protein [Microbaculum marinisediminis]|uniref:MTH938/NDUFAF3 family protein n=1 Tax=Microbaculum marinisediminis TaxID=2931392 RepID=A0AAW5R1G7_9HYPH|nr:MTH938/NDUFAF3 family protein [Microbaculum sp. A6E488]MCT8974042.1 MTH938/NDUFAF3 family protein [Microbaculum sp. A6E488]